MLEFYSFWMSIINCSLLGFVEQSKRYVWHEIHGPVTFAFSDVCHPLFGVCAVEMVRQVEDDTFVLDLLFRWTYKDHTSIL